MVELIKLAEERREARELTIIRHLGGQTGCPEHSALIPFLSTILSASTI